MTYPLEWRTIFNELPSYMMRTIDATKLYPVVVDPNFLESLNNAIVKGIDHVIVIRQ